MTFIIHRLIYSCKMWKFLVRGFRDTFEKGSERAITAVVENCQHNVAVVASSQNQERNSKSENDEFEGDTGGPFKKCQLNLHKLLEAVGLSTVLWFGAYAHYPGCWRKHNHGLSCNNEPNVPEPPVSCRYKGLLKLIAGTANAQPLTTRTASPHQEQDTEDAKEQSSATSNATPDDMSPEDALEAAKRHLQATAGRIDNTLGVVCINRGCHSDALRYFEHAWRMGDVSACYNLALCHEQGFGTPVNQTMAVQYYEKASSLGHASAMYNLGVYYSQGRGGLPVNMTKAQMLFENAAKKGLQEARIALALGDEVKVEASELEVPLDEANDFLKFLPPT